MRNEFFARDVKKSAETDACGRDFHDNKNPLDTKKYGTASDNIHSPQHGSPNGAKQFQ